MASKKKGLHRQVWPFGKRSNIGREGIDMMETENDGCTRKIYRKLFSRCRHEKKKNWNERLPLMQIQFIQIECFGRKFMMSYNDMNYDFDSAAQWTREQRARWGVLGEHFARNLFSFVPFGRPYGFIRSIMQCFGWHIQCKWASS